MTQAILIYLFKNALLNYAKKTGSYSFVRARSSGPVITYIGPEKETSNFANEGDYIVTGPAGEKYVLSPENFNKRYSIVTEPFPDTNQGLAEAKGECWYIIWGGPNFEFTAPWGEQMICNTGDILASPNREITEVYRIERSVFEKTYKEV